MEEVDHLVEDLARTQDWDYDGIVAMDECYVAVWKAERNCNLTCGQVRAAEKRLKKSQEKVARCIRMVANCNG